MPWCPKCRNEYVEGSKVCADCGCELVERLTEYVSVIFGDEDQMNALRAFFVHSGLRDVDLTYDEREAVYDLKVPKEEGQRARELLQEFLWREGRESDLRQRNGTEQSMSGGRYRDNSERAQENRSAAWILMPVGVIGCVILTLDLAGLLPFRLGNSYLVHAVMGLVFVMFFVMGVVSLKNAKLFAREAETESSLQESLLKWSKESLKGEEIDAAVGASRGDGEELLYFKRYEEIKRRLNHQFMHLDQEFLDHFIDKKVYDMVFPEHEEEPSA